MFPSKAVSFIGMRTVHVRCCQRNMRSETVVSSHYQHILPKLSMYYKEVTK